MSGLSRFWLLNGSKKKGKKSVKKVSKKISKKVSTKKSITKPTKTVAKKSVKKVIKRVVRPAIAKQVYIARPVPALPTALMTKEEKIKNIRGNKTMAKKVRKARKSAMKRRMDTAVGKHRVVAIMDKAGALRTSKKSKIAKRNIKINPFKISAKGIMNELTPAVVLSATSVGTIFGLNKVMPKIPYVNTISNSAVKASVKVAMGLIGSMIVKKVLKTKNNNIANGILIGSIIGALTDFVNISENKTVAGIKLNGVKVLGNPLSFGRPKTALANPNFQMNGIKINGKQNLSAIKFNKNYNADNTVAGCERY